MQIRTGDLDVVPEHAVVPPLQRADAGARPLALFELGNHLLARSADPPEMVQFGVQAVTNEAPIADGTGGSSTSASSNRFANVGEVIERAEERLGQRRLAILQESRGLVGTAVADCWSATRSRGRARPRAARDTSRSMSCTVFMTSRNLPRSVVRNAKSSTASSQSAIRSSATSGRRSQETEQAAAHRRDRTGRWHGGASPPEIR